MLFALLIIVSSLFPPGCQAPLKNKGVTYLPDYSGPSQGGLLFRQNGEGSRLSYESIFFISDLPSKINKSRNKNTWLGVGLTEKEISANKKTGEKHLLIRYVVRNSPAENFGLKKGDVILKLNGEIIPLSTGESPSEYFVKKMGRHSPASKVTLTILRDNSKHEIIVELGTRPEAPVIMAEHTNISSSMQAGESILEKTLKKRKMLSAYYKVADKVKKKSADVISYHFEPGNLNPFRLTEVNYLLNHPLNVPQVTQDLTGQIKKYFSSSVKNISGLLNYTAKKIDVNYSPGDFIALPQDPTLDTLIEYIEQVFQKALSLREDAFAMLSEEDMSFLYSYSEIYLPQTTEITEEEESAIIIDLGGDDIYYNNAGSSSKSSPLSLLIDLSGNDKYISSQPFTQGCGLLGTGILIDLSGDDLYTAGDISQGIGIIGIGLLVDFEGDDRFFGKSSVQGCGHDFGIGVLIDTLGNDFYKGGVLVQGFGNETGIGIMYDNKGNDTYVSKGPGAGNYSSLHEAGSIGLYVDAEGEDNYSSRDKNHSVLSRNGWGLFWDM